MRTPTRAAPPASDPSSSTASTATPGDAEALFRAKPISEIRAVEASTRREIDAKSEELRQLVGRSYRDLIDSADSILLIRSISLSISSNLDLIHSSLLSLSSSAQSPSLAPSTPPSSDPIRSQIYSSATRVKYLVDSPEHIWGRLDESMLLEASGRYLRARLVHSVVSREAEVVSRFPLLRHQWQIVDSFKPQISLRARERLLAIELPLPAYADALAAAATVDDLDPEQALALFLDSRRSWISQKVSENSCSTDVESYSSFLCNVVRIVRDSLGQVGELFVLALNEMPMFYKTVLGSPPGTQLFGGIANPEEEVRLWKAHREKLEWVMVLLEPEFVAQTCSQWLLGCCDQIFGASADGNHFIDAIASGEVLASVGKLVRETLDSREGLDGSLEQWLKNVFGSEIESPWNQIRGMILKDGKDILENKLEEAFMKRMKEIMHSRFEDLSKEINVRSSMEAIVARPNDDKRNDFQLYLKKPCTGGGVWFSDPNHKKSGPLYNLKLAADENDFWTCLNAYFGAEVGRIREAVDSRCGSILEDLLCFVDSHNSMLRLKDLVPYLQGKCYKTISAILQELEDMLGQLSTALGENKGDKDLLPSSVIVERSLFIGRLLFALRNHSSHIPLILGSPRQWAKTKSGQVFTSQPSPLSRQSPDSLTSFSPRRQTFDSPISPRRQFLDSPRRQTISAAAALFSVDDKTNPKLDVLNKNLQELCIKAHNLWITWISDELAVILSSDLSKDDSLSTSTSPRGWEVTVIKQEESSEGPLEMTISLPSMPSLYITSFLFQACLEIHRVGGHVLDKVIVQTFAWRLLQKVVSTYECFLPNVEASESRVSEKGLLQVLLDLRFTADILSGAKDSTSASTELNAQEVTTKLPFRRRQSQFQPVSLSTEPVMALIHRLSQRLDPIDWATFEPYLWENEKQSYKRYAVLFGFLVQLNRMYTDTVQQLPTKSNTDSNILRCSAIPRFKYLPISAPALSSRGSHKAALQISTEDGSRSPWKAYSNGEQSPKSEFDDSLSFGVATPLLKSFMTQVGSKFGESTSRWGSMLSDGQVGKFKAMSTFGDILPPAAGLFSSLTAGAGRSES